MDPNRRGQLFPLLPPPLLPLEVGRCSEDDETVAKQGGRRRERRWEGGRLQVSRAKSQRKLSPDLPPLISRTLKSTYPVLPFLDCSVFTKENPKFTKDFPPLPNPLKPWKKQGKHPNNQGNSLLKIYQGNPNNQGKEGQGKEYLNQRGT